MSELGEVKRRRDGSIDTVFYVQKARALRAAAVGEFLCSAAGWSPWKIRLWTQLSSWRLPARS